MQNNQPTLDQAGSKDSACPPQTPDSYNLIYWKDSGSWIVTFTESPTLGF